MLVGTTFEGIISKNMSELAFYVQFSFKLIQYSVVLN